MTPKTAILILLPVIAVFQSGAQPTASAATQATGSDQINFLSIVVDGETAAADTRLRKFLERAVADGATPGSAQRTVRFQQQTMPYGDVIRSFAEPDPGRGYLARITPYAYVAAEMLGAKLNILAVYQSAATRDTTYHSYFVVRKDLFSKKTLWTPERGEAGLEDVETYLRSFQQQPAKFMYHDRFSTSSYFMPSLYFKTHEVFAMSHSLNPHLIRIEVERLAATSSSELVKRVISEQADLVAVGRDQEEIRAREQHPVHPDPDGGAQRLSRGVRSQRADAAADRGRRQEGPCCRPAVHRSARPRHHVNELGAQAPSAV
jgi:hypothetical protein